MHQVLHSAEQAVSKSNDILLERIAALEATNDMAVKQGLGAYGPLSSEDVWPDREPAPGKSEQIASGASDVVRNLVQQVGLAQAKANRFQARLEQAEWAAQHGAEVTAEQKHIIRELSAQLDEQTQTAKVRIFLAPVSRDGVGVCVSCGGPLCQSQTLVCVCWDFR